MIPGYGFLASELRVVPRAWHERNKGIVKVHAAAALFDELDELEGGAFPQVVDVLLVGDADEQDIGAVEPAVGRAVERRAQALDHEARHGIVDLAGELDEAGRNLELARLPREIERVDWDAVPAETRSRIEGHVAEGLCLRRLDHLPDIDPHGAVDELQLVDESDVDRTEDVLGELDRLRRR